MADYFSTDWHLDHANVIKYDNRPFKDVREMNKTIIDNYNKIVKPNDNFYFLGDFCFNIRNAEEHLSKLNGNLFFIKGNHDKQDMIRLYQRYGTYLGEQKKIKVQGQEIVLNHYGMRVWDKSHHGTWCLYGHSHGSLPDDPNSLSMDVGCMLFDYKPLEFAQIKEIMSKKTWKPIDHHNGSR
jgi:calcineurin-like phosphoesterase family protein